jgi:4-amino-4-deoxy-L-arabinose transferase-like glycosyltransferase
MRRIINIVTKNWLILAIIAAAIFLRFYKIGEFTVFLADQGRDAIIVKRIAAFEHFPAIGAPTSVGQVFLGPFYYYFIAPWFWLFNFNPVGLAVGMAVTSIAYLVTTYFIVKQFFDKRAAVIATFLGSFSYVLIQSSRFSWNPNPLPLFSLLTAYFFMMGTKTKHYLYFLLFGAFLSFSIQLHYLAAGLVLPILILSVFDLISSRKEILKKTVNYLLSLVSFIVFTSPLIIFDLRHNFINVNSLFNLLKSGAGVAGGKLAGFMDTFSEVNKYLFNIDINSVTAIVLFIIFLFLLAFNIMKKKYNLSAMIIFFIGTLVVASLYPGVKHAHYLGMLYPFYIVVISAILGDIFKYDLFDKSLVILFLAAFLYLNFQKYEFFWTEPNNQVRHAKLVAEFIDKKITSDKFNFAVQPDGWQEDSYLYFLELKGKVPQDRKMLEVGTEMFVVCGNPCNIKQTKSWNITMFGDSKITNQWETQGVKIYRLEHIK